ncbi:hypothetical protein HJD18_08440 [Thermoleophilia bacterium SCSIO 60948]|nr:hypothetical protein HJD18_08440 [Thermoleophilia bacterium SCSIO 60948]
MLEALALILPLGLASALGPLMLTEQTLLLALPGGRRPALGYAGGVVAATVLLVAAIIVLGSAIRLPAEPRLDARLDLAIGAALMVAALVVWASRRLHAPAAGPATESFASGAAGIAAAAALGVGAVVTNLTGIPLIAAAAKEISAAGLGSGPELALAALLVALGSAPAWVPLALTRIAPEAGERFLGALGEGMRRYGRLALTVLLAGAGIYFVLRGLVRLV